MSPLINLLVASRWSKQYGTVKHVEAATNLRFVDLQIHGLFSWVDAMTDDTMIYQTEK